MQRTFAGFILAAVVAAVAVLGVVGWNKGEALTGQIATMSQQLEQLNESQQKLVDMQSAAATATFAIEGRAYLGSPDRPAKNFRIIVLPGDLPLGIRVRDGEIAVPQLGQRGGFGAENANAAIGRVRDLLTDETGAFRSGPLPPGMYELAFVPVDREGRPAGDFVYRTNPYRLYTTGAPHDVALDVAVLDSQVRVRFAPPLPSRPNDASPALFLRASMMYVSSVSDGDEQRDVTFSYSGGAQGTINMGPAETSSGTFNYMSSTAAIANFGGQSDSQLQPLALLNGRFEIVFSTGIFPESFWQREWQDQEINLRRILGPGPSSLFNWGESRPRIIGEVYSFSDFPSRVPIEVLAAGIELSLGIVEAPPSSTLDVEIRWPGLPDPLTEEAAQAISDWTADDFEVVVTPVEEYQEHNTKSESRNPKLLRSTKSE